MQKILETFDTMNGHHIGEALKPLAHKIVDGSECPTMGEFDIYMVEMDDDEHIWIVFSCHSSTADFVDIVQGMPDEIRRHYRKRFCRVSTF